MYLTFGAVTLYYMYEMANEPANPSVRVSDAHDAIEGRPDNLVPLVFFNPTLRRRDDADAAGRPKLVLGVGFSFVRIGS